MLARHAENMYWAGRYVERAEDTARMLDATLQSSVSTSPQQASVRFRTLMQTLRHEVPEGPMSGADVLELLVAAPDAPGSILSSIARTRENLRSLREQIPAEFWEQTNRLHLLLQGPRFHDDLLRDPFAALEVIRDGCQRLSGTVTTAMSRDEGYRFLVLGNTIERSLMTCRLVNVRFPQLSESSYDEMALTLRSASALEAYQRAFHASTDPDDVVRFLLVNDRFPRSLLFCLRQAEEQLTALGRGAPSRPRRLMGQLRSRLEFADMAELLADLPDSIDDYENGLRHAAGAIGTHFFRNAEELDLRSQMLVPGHAP